MPKILVIDDDRASRELLAYLLQHAGHAVRTANDGELGVRAMTDAIPDLVVCDCQMPHRSGLQVAAFMQADARLRDVPLVAVTAAALPADRERALAAGFARYIVKPFDPSTIVSILEATLDAARSRTRGDG
ncbi:MAG: response regulator [Gammaproteobacteria bacterium]|nr:response regulator [Gammaproteobacteria bacterium]